MRVRAQLLPFEGWAERAAAATPSEEFDACAASAQCAARAAADRAAEAPAGAADACALTQGSWCLDFLSQARVPLASTTRAACPRFSRVSHAATENVLFCICLLTHLCVAQPTGSA